MRCDLKSLQYRRRRRRVSAIIAPAIEVKRISSSRRRSGEKQQEKRIGPRTFISLARTEFVFRHSFLFICSHRNAFVSVLACDCHVPFAKLFSLSLSLSVGKCRFRYYIALFTRVVCLKAEPAIHYYIIFHQPIRWGRLISLHFSHFCASLNPSVCLST